MERASQMLIDLNLGKFILLMMKFTETLIKAFTSLPAEVATGLSRCNMAMHGVGVTERWFL